MAEGSEEELHTDAIAQAQIEERERFPIVWLIPFIAALIGSWLAYWTVSERGPTITISFQTAAGIEEGKTTIKYKNVRVGVVDNVEIREETYEIIVTATLEKSAETHLRTGTRFWVVRPRLGTGGISGLDTLVSGAYIELEPGDGSPTDTFTGLEEPPVIRADVPGSEYILVTDELGSVAAGTPVFFRQIRVGEVLGYELTPDLESVLVYVFVRAPHDALIRKNSRFWKASGIELSVDAQGIKARTESLEVLLLGGIAFDSPKIGQSLAAPSEAGSKFTLYNSRERVEEGTYTKKDQIVMYFEGSLRGLSVGAPVEFMGIKLGTVTNVRAYYDADEAKFYLPVHAELEPERVAVMGKDFEMLNEARQYQQLVQDGMRAQLQVSNLLTGQLYIALAMHPDDRITATRSNDRPWQSPWEIPTIPTALDEFKRSATGLMTELRSIPLGDLVTDVRSAVQSIDRLASAPELHESMRSLHTTLERTEKLMRDLDTELIPLVADLRSTSSNADQVLEQANEALAALADGSQLRIDLGRTLEEAANASRSIRVLADYLERNPQALLYGKARR